MINSGNTYINEIHYQGFTISKVYACGGELVWNSSSPTGTSKLTYITNSGDTYVIRCDGVQTLTRVELINDMNSHSLPPLYNYVLSDAIVGDCVSTLSSNLFNDMFSLSSVTIPSSVTTIEDSVFKNTDISSITIPSSVTSIGSFAFFGCDKLTSIEIPSGVTQINLELLSDCSKLLNIVLPSTITSIDNSAFHLQDYQYPDPRYDDVRIALTGRSVTIYATTPPTLGDGVFGFDGGDELCTYPIYVPCESVDAYKEAWSYWASRIVGFGCKKWKATYSGGLVTSAECGGSSSIIENEINLTNLVSVEIGNCVTEIGMYAFISCRSLTSIDIPSGVTSIGKYTFYGCSGLASITVNATTPPTLGSNALNNTNNCPIYVPSGSVNTYKSASGWSAYASRIQAIT